MNENSQKTQHSIRKRLLEVYPENDFDVAIHFSKGSLVFDIVINILGDLGYIYAAERTAQIAYQSLNTIICNIAESEIKKEITFNKKDAALSNLSILPVNADKKKFSSNQGVDIDLNGSIIELKKIYFAVVSVAILASIALILFLAVLYVSTH